MSVPRSSANARRAGAALPAPGALAAVLTEVLPARSHPDGIERPARFVLEPWPGRDVRALAADVEVDLAAAGARVSALSELDEDLLVLDLAAFTLDGCPPSEAFAMAYALADAYQLRTAEPDLATPFFPEPDVPEPDVPEPDVPEPDVPGPDVPGSDLRGPDQHPAPAQGLPVVDGLRELPGCTSPAEPALLATPRWALDRMRVPEAWALSTQEGRPAQGAGIVVAQPDTGITAHAELAGVHSAGGFDVLDNDPDPTDHLGVLSPGHGTGTASVLLSPPTLSVTGAAPQARHMPIRATESVVRLTQVSIARAVDWAVAHGAHVITMSLGGVPSVALHRAVERAVRADVIVLAAAGNCVGLVVWPARYDECIAVAGTNSTDQPWPGSCRGGAVDVSAPAQNVLRAQVANGAGPGNAAVGPGQGTSFAVAMTAGVAALWLAHHRRTALLAAAHQRGETLQEMFVRLVRATARRPAGWNTSQMGAGIVDARALLAAGLDLGLSRGLERAAVLRPGAALAERATLTVQSLVADAVGPDAVDAGVTDWHRYGPEIATLLLGRQLAVAGTGLEVEVAAAVSSDLAAAVRNPRLGGRLGLGRA